MVIKVMFNGKVFLLYSLIREILKYSCVSYFFVIYCYAVKAGETIWTIIFPILGGA